MFRTFISFKFILQLNLFKQLSLQNLEFRDGNAQFICEDFFGTISSVLDIKYFFVRDTFKAFCFCIFNVFCCNRIFIFWCLFLIFILARLRVSLFFFLPEKLLELSLCGFPLRASFLEKLQLFSKLLFTY